MANRADWIVAPELPVRSPARAAFFDDCRRTFTEDWAEAERACAASIREAKGDLYFVRVGEFVKIGRTTNLSSRMKMIDCHAPTPPELLGVVEGGGWLEQSWHDAYKHLRSNREWFRLTPELENSIEMTLRRSAPLKSG